MTDEESTIQTGIIIAAESFGFGFDAETGDGSGLTTSRSSSSFDFALMNWAWSTRSIGRPPFSKNFSLAIRGGCLCWRGKENKGVKRRESDLTVGGCMTVPSRGCYTSGPLEPPALAPRRVLVSSGLSL